MYYKLKTPFGVTSRDFLSRRTVVHNWPEEGAAIIYMKSIENDLMPKRRKIIRAENLITGYILRRTGPSSSSMTIISQADMKGMLPKVVVNKFAGTAPREWVKNLSKACAKFEPTYR